MRVVAILRVAVGTPGTTGPFPYEGNAPAGFRPLLDQKLPVVTHGLRRTGKNRVASRRVTREMSRTGNCLLRNSILQEPRVALGPMLDSAGF